MNGRFNQGRQGKGMAWQALSAFRIEGLENS